MILPVSRIGFVKILMIAVSFATTVILTNVFGAEEFGVYVAIVNIVLVLATTAKWGWDGAAIRFVACAIADNDRQDAQNFSRYANGTVLRQGLAVGLSAAAVLIMSSHIDPMVSSVPGYGLWFIVGCTPLVALSILQQGVLRGAKKQIAAEIPEGLVKPIVVVVIALLLSGVREWPQGLQMLLGFASGCLIAWLIGVVRANATIGSDAIAVEPALSRKSDWRSATRSHGVVNLCQTIIARSPIVVGAFVLTSSELGVLAVTMRIAESVQLGLTAVGLHVAPRIAELYYAGRITDLRKTLKEASILSCVSASIGAATIILLADWILGLFGAEFSSGAPLLLILIGGQVVATSVGPVGYLATMTGHQQAAARVLLLVALFALGGAAVLGKLFGATGLVIASSLGVGLWGILLSRLGRRIIRAATIVE